MVCILYCVCVWFCVWGCVCVCFTGLGLYYVTVLRLCVCVCVCFTGLWLYYVPARNLWVIIDDQLTFTAHDASVSRSYRYALFNIRKIRPYLTQYTTQLLVQTLVSS